MAEEAATGETRTYQLRDGKLVSCLEDDENVADPDTVLDRRQRGRFGYEYEVRWFDARKTTTWVPRWQLTAMGFVGMVKREDTRQAALQSLIGRPLTTPAVEHTWQALAWMQRKPRTDAWELSPTASVHVLYWVQRHG